MKMLLIALLFILLLPILMVASLFAGVFVWAYFIIHVYHSFKKGWV